MILSVVVGCHILYSNEQFLMSPNFLSDYEETLVQKFGNPQIPRHEARISENRDKLLLKMREKAQRENLERFIKMKLRTSEKLYKTLLHELISHEHIPEISVLPGFSYFLFLNYSFNLDSIQDMLEDD